jgi:hypothetical protein
MLLPKTSERRKPAREAIMLASFFATLLAPFVTGVLINAQSVVGEPINGISALFGALLEMPGTLALVWIGLFVSGRLTAGTRWPSILSLIAATAVIGGCVALFRLDAIDRLNEWQGWAALGVFLFAGALTGAAYAWLICFWDRLLRALSE